MFVRNAAVCCSLLEQIKGARCKALVGILNAAKSKSIVSWRALVRHTIHLTIQCFPSYVSCWRPASHFFVQKKKIIIIKSLFFCLFFKLKKMSASHVLIAFRKKIPKNYNFYVVKRRLYGMCCIQCIALFAIIQILLFVLFTINVLCLIV